MAARTGSDVLVVDDEKNIRATLTMCLEAAGCVVTSAGTSEAALAAVERKPFDLAFLDLRLGEQDGMALLPRLLAARPGLAIVVITAYATIDTAVEAIKRGAVNYLPKPFTPGRSGTSSIRSRRGARPRPAWPISRPWSPTNCPASTSRRKRRACGARSSWRRARPAPTRRSCCAARTAPARARWRG
jgi:CheY-like chemotaxis protein